MTYYESSYQPWVKNVMVRPCDKRATIDGDEIAGGGSFHAENRRSLGTKNGLSIDSKDPLGLGPEAAAPGQHGAVAQDDLGVRARILNRTA
jgi:hypothetical protein